MRKGKPALTCGYSSKKVLSDLTESFQMWQRNVVIVAGVGKGEFMDKEYFLDEEWVQINEFPDYYVSNFGRVYDSKRNRILTEYVNKGYLQVSIEKNGKWRVYPVHRFVGAAFVPGYFEGAEINHIDENKQNNVVENLEWVTHAENMRHYANPNREYIEMMMKNIARNVKEGKLK